MNYYQVAAATIFVFAHLFFIFAAKNKRNDYADIMWGLGFLVAILGVLIVTRRPFLIEDWLPITCVFIWGLRLSWYIGTRVLSHPSEDARYLKMRQGWGPAWLINSYLKVFILQATLLFVVSLPALHWTANGYQGHITTFIVGLVIWLIGFVFEVLSDAQLKNFKKNPENKSKVMDQGLWKYSRHPNYFGEVMLWWGIYIMTFDATVWYFIISPILITFLILKVSGVSMMEELMKNRPGFSQYAKRTSVFFPLPPRRP